MNTTMTETETTTTTPAATMQKWAAGEGLGPRMLKTFNDAIKAAGWNARGMKTLRGIIGKPETQKDDGFVSVALFGGPMNPEYAPKIAAIQAKHGHVITAANYKVLTAEVNALAAWLAANPNIKDERITQEAHDEREATLTAFNERMKREQAEAAAKKLAAQNSARSLYPWAKQEGSRWARGAANLRTMLAKEFPGIGFGVTSESYAGGCSISVSWENGPTEAEVKAISDRFQECDFDGSQDLEVQRDDTRGFTSWMGGAKYVSEYRTVSDAQVIVSAALAVPGGVAGFTRSAPGRFDDDSAERVAADLLTVTSFPAGAVVTGVAKLADGEDCGPGRGHAGRYRITFEAPSAAAAVAASAAASAGANGATVTLNAEKNGVEVRFPSKPGADVIERLKSAGFRWARFSSCWYAKQSPRMIERAKEIAGVSAEPAPTTEIEGGL